METRAWGLRVQREHEESAAWMGWEQELLSPPLMQEPSPGGQSVGCQVPLPWPHGQEGQGEAVRPGGSWSGVSPGSSTDSRSNLGQVASFVCLSFRVCRMEIPLGPTL